MRICYKILLMVMATTLAQASGFDFRFKRDLFMDLEHIEATVLFDQNQATCIVDTGARFTLAKEELVPNNLKVGEQKGGGVSGQENVTDLVESNVQVGTWVRNKNVIGRKPANKIPFTCLLGNDFFLEKEFVIDFKTQRFSEDVSFSGSVFKLNRYPSEIGGHFGFPIKLGGEEGEEVESLFDTGATNTVVDTAFVESHPENFTFVRNLEVTEGSNQTVTVGVYRAKSIRFGIHEDRNIEVYVISLKYLQSKIPGIKAIVGLNQMMDRQWYFNHRNSTWGMRRFLIAREGVQNECLDFRC